MPDWRSDYLESLQEAERNNPVNKDLVQACQLAPFRLTLIPCQHF